MCAPLNSKGFNVTCLSVLMVLDAQLCRENLGACSDCTKAWYGVPLYLFGMEFVPIKHNFCSFKSV